MMRTAGNMDRKAEGMVMATGTDMTKWQNRMW